MSSHAKLRAEVVPQPEPPAGLDEPLSQLSLPGEQLDEPIRRKPWGWLLRHVFQAELENCHLCGGPMRWLEVATEPEDIARLIARHGQALTRHPPAGSSRAPPEQLELPLLA